MNFQVHCQNIYKAHLAAEMGNGLHHRKSAGMGFCNIRYTIAINMPVLL
jgi:hypothetical protein